MALIVFLLCVAHPAAAQVDMNGPWSTNIFIVFVPSSSPCTPINFTQTGTGLTISGTCNGFGTFSAAGTIDPGTGDFDAIGSGGAGCTTLTITNGNAAADQRTFYMQFSCTGGFPFQGAVYGYRCGNGVIDAIAAEDCDEGDRENGDCCDDVCQFDPPGQLCFNGDSNECTAEMCDGAGTCTSQNLTGPSCSDGNQCTSGDACAVGVCVGTALPDGSACDDYDSCTNESCQGGTCAATTKPDGAACNDGYDCQSGETCLGGVCQVGADVVCGACKTCFEGLGCVGDPTGYPSEDASASVLQLKKTNLDRVKWKWASYNAIESTDFGDPTTATGYEICVFDPFNPDPVTGYPQLLFSASVPAGSGWRHTPSGYLYQSSDKRLKVRLKAGAVGKGKILVRAKGPGYGVAYLPPVDAVEAKLRTSAGVTPAISFEAYFGTPITSTSTKFKAQTPFP